MAWYSDLFNVGIDKVVGSVAKGLDSLITSDEERLELKLESTKAKQSFHLENRRLDLQEEELYIKDVQSARVQQTKVQESENASMLAKNIQPVLAIVVTFATIGLFYLVMFQGMPKEGDPNIIMFVLGSLSAAFTMVLGYFFGSTKSSAEKTQLIAKVNK
ncbi:MAG: hypothetical protein HRT37_14490 [Alteromonadaceae bacterium]|nr:hypothetical protein [Alteromonadaceae bacterium]